MDKTLLDLYSDYLLSSYTATPSTRLSALLKGAISHDKITRFLAEDVPKSRDLWHIVKPHVRAVESADGVLIIDDSIEEKPYTDENDIVCWHYDHSSGRQVKGINFMTAIYHSQSVSLPVGFEIVAKTEHYRDEGSKAEKRRSPISKNTYYQSLLREKSNRILHRHQRCLVCFRREYDVCQAYAQKAFCDALEKQPQGGIVSDRETSRQVPFSRHARYQGKHCAGNLSRRS